FGNVTEDRNVTVTGSFPATGSQVGQFWVMQMAAFKAAGGGPADTASPSTPAGLSATAVSASQINLSWTASNDNVGVTGYRIFRNGAQINTSSSNSYSDT